MKDQKWTQDALHNHPVNLTSDQKARLLEAVPELENHLIDIEKICSGFLYGREIMSTRQSKADAMLYFYGDKNEVGYIAKLKRSLESNFDLMQTFDKASPWLTMHRSGPLFTSLKAVNAQLIIAIKKAEEQAQDYRTNRSQASVPEHYLVMALCDLYHEITGLEVTRRNPTPTHHARPEQSPIADIIKILHQSINCGPCTGHITKAIRTIKEIKNLDQGL